jgi:predicted transcriptional regulator
MLMPKGESLRPTEAELQILKVLWKRGASTVREVHEILNESKPIIYTTVLKLMQIMTEKNLVKRDLSQRAHLYQANVAERETQQQLVSDLLEKVFDGSASQLVMRALTNKKASQKEISEIRDLLDEFERGKN